MPSEDLLKFEPNVNRDVCSSSAYLLQEMGWPSIQICPSLGGGIKNKSCVSVAFNSATAAAKVGLPFGANSSFHSTDGFISRACRKDSQAAGLSPCSKSAIPQEIQLAELCGRHGFIQAMQSRDGLFKAAGRGAVIHELDFFRGRLKCGIEVCECAGGVCCAHFKASGPASPGLALAKACPKSAESSCSRSPSMATTTREIATLLFSPWYTTRSFADTGSDRAKVGSNRDVRASAIVILGSIHWRGEVYQVSVFRAL